MSDQTNPVVLRETDQGLLLPVLAQPGAKRDGIVGVHDGRLKVAVRQIAEGGKANRALIKLLAREIGLKPNQLTLHAGTGSRRKEILIQGIELQSLRHWLSRITKP